MQLRHYEDRIVCTPGVRRGAPRLDGSRLTVFDLVIACRNEDALEAAGATYGIEGKLCVLALEYCRLLKCIDDRPNEFCSGCRLESLRAPEESTSGDAFICMEPDGPSAPIDWSSEKVRIFLGTRRELEAEEDGLRGWELAEEAYRKFNLGTNSAE